MATLVKKGRLGQVRVWRIEVQGDQVHRWSGQKDGAMTHTFDTPGPAGKPGTKAFVSAEDRALERALYLTKKKKDAGYREVDPETFELLEDEATGEIEWDGLPRNFEVGKPLDPKTKRDLKAREDLVSSSNSIITLKEDGLCYIVMIGDRVEIYSRKMEYFTAHFPWVVNSIQAMRFPARTILTCEFVIKKADGRDDRKAMQSLKGKADRTVKKQENPLMRPTAVVLNTPYWAGEPVLKTQTVLEWMSTLQDFFESRFEDAGNLKRRVRYGHVRPMEVLFMDFAEAKRYVVENEHEGLVIYDKTSCFGDKAFNFRGTTERTPCFKWKPYFECDCVVIFNPDKEFDHSSLGIDAGEYGTAGKVRGLPKNVGLFQWDGTDSDRKLIHLSNCGSGFDIPGREDVLKRARAHAGYCGVAEIRYASRFFQSRGDDTNALLEPIFKGWHADKELTEAVEPKLRDWT